MTKKLLGALLLTALVVLAGALAGCSNPSNGDNGDGGGNGGGGGGGSSVNAAIVEYIAEYISANPGSGAAASPVPLDLDIDLSTGWAGLLSAIQNTYVTLDLTDCTMSGTEFDPGTDNTGEPYIVSLTLPAGVTSVKASDYSSPTFKNFTALTEFNAAAVETIGEFAFRACTTLKTVELPAVVYIDHRAFDGCSSLETIELLAAQTIDDGAFEDCTTLKTVNLPVVQTIGGVAFWGCTALETVNLPASLTVIGINPFRSCTSLTEINVDPENPAYKSQNGMLLNKDGTTLIAYPTAKGVVNLPKITVVANQAFFECALTTVTLPAATSIGEDAFYRCTSLTSVEFPTAQTIGDYAFSSTGNQTLAVTLGPTAPTLGRNMFSGVSAAKTVTVTVPSGATGYGSTPGNTADVCWGNGFRGGGWTGSAFVDGDTVNGNVNLTITYDTP